MTNNSNSAIVIGASVAGLLAACALSDHFARVVILEREVLPPPGQGRKAVPQGRHVHALLPGGLAAIERLLPGFQAELVAGGAVRCDSMQEIRFVASGHRDHPRCRLRHQHPRQQAIHRGSPAATCARVAKHHAGPRGLVALGDAISSFNPVYGQGMSVAALQAIALSEALSSGVDRLSQRYFKATRRIVDTAWDLATGSDLSLPEVNGERSLLTRLSNAWVERILQAAEDDAYVAEAFGSVTDLLAPPTVLMQPRLIWRVIKNVVKSKQARRRVRVGKAVPLRL